MTGKEKISVKVRNGKRGNKDRIEEKEICTKKIRRREEAKGVGSKRESERDVNQLSPPLQAAHSKGKLAQ